MARHAWRSAWIRVVTVAGLLMVLAGCAGRSGHMDVMTPPANIHHVVFISLDDPDDADALLHDSDRMLATIPGVVSYWAGTHHETGREHIRRDYDVALYVGYMTDEDYAVYVDHPNHIEFVEKWRPRLTELRVYDVYDDGSRRR